MSTKTARLDLRLTEDQRTLLERAATVVGSSLASYCITTLTDAAIEDVARSTTLKLSDADWRQFLDALDAPDDDAWRRLRAREPVWAS